MAKFSINFKHKFTFLYNALVLLSFISAALYAARLLGAANTDKIMLAFSIAVLSLYALAAAGTIYQKLTVILVFLILITFYIAVWQDFSAYLAAHIAGSAVKYGVLNMVLNTFSLGDIEYMFAFTSYGGSAFIDGEIVNGAVNLFNSGSGYNTPLYLTGKFFLHFAAAGIALSFKEHRRQILIIALFAVVSGNFTCFLILLMFCKTPYYFIFLVFSFLSYLLSYMANLSAGYFCSGGIIEFYAKNDAVIYITALGVLILCISYYVSRLVHERKKC
ncbi:MAG: hypothetical protein LUH82_00465 [Clostridiales bacterium]|nr:hypothetical protein [Clostridiales bacterium]